MCIEDEKKCRIHSEARLYISLYRYICIWSKIHKHTFREYKPLHFTPFFNIFKGLLLIHESFESPPIYNKSPAYHPPSPCHHFQFSIRRTTILCKFKHSTIQTHHHIRMYILPYYSTVYMDGWKFSMYSQFSYFSSRPYSSPIFG